MIIPLLCYFLVFWLPLFEIHLASFENSTDHIRCMQIISKRDRKHCDSSPESKNLFQESLTNHFMPALLKNLWADYVVSEL